MKLLFVSKAVTCCGLVFFFFLLSQLSASARIESLIMPDVQPFERGSKRNGPSPTEAEDEQAFKAAMKDLWARYPAPAAEIVSDAAILDTKSEKTREQFTTDCSEVRAYLEKHRAVVEGDRIADLERIETAVGILFDEDRTSAIQMNAAYAGIAIIISNVQRIIHAVQFEKSSDVVVTLDIFPDDTSVAVMWLTDFIRSQNPLDALDKTREVFNLNRRSDYTYLDVDGEVVIDEAVGDSKPLTVAERLQNYKDPSYLMLVIYRLNQLGVFPEAYLRNGDYAPLKDLGEHIARFRPILDCGTQLLSIDGTDALGTAYLMFIHDLAHAYFQEETSIFEKDMRKSTLQIPYQFVSQLCAHVDFKNHSHGFVSYLVFHEGTLRGANMKSIRELMGVGYDDHCFNFNPLIFLPNPKSMSREAFESYVRSSIMATPARRISRMNSHRHDNSEQNKNLWIIDMILESHLPRDRRLESAELKAAFPALTADTIVTTDYVAYNQLFDMVEELSRAGHDIQVWKDGVLNVSAINALVDRLAEEFIRDIGSKRFG